MSSARPQHADEPVIVIAGPTASGKTALSLEVARRCGGGVVSADSRQIYRYLDIGTAKPSASERGEVPHYGLDVVTPDVRYSAGRFGREARGWVRELRERGLRPVVAGGSGLYLRALVDGFFEGADVKDEQVRAELEAEADRSLAVLYKELQSSDPVYAEKTAPNDRQRILRALEVIRVSGAPFSSLHGRNSDRAPFEVRWFGIELPRRRLYERIDRRVGDMLDRGLVREVEDLLDRGYGGANALKSVGYEEIIAWKAGRLPSLEAAAEEIRKNTRHYARRQLTWFRAEERIRWLDGTRPAGELAGTVLAESAREPDAS